MTSPECLEFLQRCRPFPVFVDDNLTPVMIYEWGPSTASPDLGPQRGGETVAGSFIERERAKLQRTRSLPAASDSRTISDDIAGEDCTAVSPLSGSNPACKRVRKAL